MWMLPSKVMPDLDWQHLWWIHRFYNVAFVSYNWPQQQKKKDHSELVSAQCGRQSEPGLFSFVPLYIMCEKLNEKPCHVCQSFSKSPMTFDARRTMTIIHPQMWPNTFCFCHIVAILAKISLGGGPLQGVCCL